jgi:hypothetical protein
MYLFISIYKIFVYLFIYLFIFILIYILFMRIKHLNTFNFNLIFYYFIMIHLNKY